jgi:FKBP-type peptidyl-prolyl cis-trans isomerase SlyD
VSKKGQNPDDVVAQDKVVIIHYTLKDDEGEELDSSIGGDPLPLLQGHGNIVPGLEKALLGKSVGEKLKVVVPPQEGYGELNGQDPQPVPRTDFPEDMELELGDPIMAETEDGEHIPLWVADLDDQHVYLDTNHPLAGETLYFEVEIVSIRAATEAELTHGHPHGLDGTEVEEDEDEDGDWDEEDEDLDDEDLDEEEDEADVDGEASDGKDN